MPLLLAAAAAVLALSDTDKNDLRCVWVGMEAARLAESSETKSLMMGMTYWFEGRLAGRHPDMLVQNYVIQKFTFAGLKTTDADLTFCAGTFSAWQERDIRG